MIGEYESGAHPYDYLLRFWAVPHVMDKLGRHFESSRTLDLTYPSVTLTPRNLIKFQVCVCIYDSYIYITLFLGMTDYGGKAK